MEKERGEQRIPRELNNEFRKLLASAPSVQLGVRGLVFDDPWEGASNLKHNEGVRYEELVKVRSFSKDPLLILDAWTDMISREVLKRERLDSRYRVDVLSKLSPLIPFIKGTESFRSFFVPRELGRVLIDGISHAGQDHYFYGDDRGGIFNDDSVREIEERSFQVFIDDIKSHEVPHLRPGTRDVKAYNNTLIYEELVDRGREWGMEFIGKYSRFPLDKNGGELQIP